MDKEYKRLKKWTEDHQKMLDQERERKKSKPVQRMDEGQPNALDNYPFWCDTCQEDFSAPCYKTRHRIEGGEWISVYRAKCPNCETECIRHITHRDEDLYYNKSTKIRVQSREYRWETLQPHEHGFKTLYGEPYEEFERNMIKAEENIIKEERNQGFRGRSLLTKEKIANLNHGR